MNIGFGYAVVSFQKTRVHEIVIRHLERKLLLTPLELQIWDEKVTQLEP